MSRSPTCGRCREPMVEGFVMDRGHGNHKEQAQWIEGPPEEMKWLGMNLGLKTKGKKMLKVSVWRCPRCGLLESYA